MATNWVGDDHNDVVASIDKYRLHCWRDDEDWNWTIGIDDGPVARGFAATLEGAKAAALEAVEDHRGGGLQ
jgi:hypothetical protein